MDDRKTAIRIVANLAQRVRRARKQLREAKKRAYAFHHLSEIAEARTRENEAWNAFQASKKILNQTLGEEVDA